MYTCHMYMYMYTVYITVYTYMYFLPLAMTQLSAVDVSYVQHLATLRIV